MNRSGLGLVVALAIGASWSAAAADIVSGRDLVTVCARERADLPAADRGAKGQTSPGAAAAPGGEAAGRLSCKDYLQGYLRASQSSEVQSATGRTGTGLNRVCVRWPSFLSYRDMADILAEYGAAHDEALALPAQKLADAAFAARYPCPDR